MTTFRSSLGLAAALLLWGCERQPDGQERTGATPPAAASAPESPPAVPDELLAKVPAPAPPRPAATRHPLAGTDRPTPTYQRCMETGEAGKGVTSGMRECLAAELERQDERLNAAYRTVMAALASGDQATLRSLQRTWILQRDEDCAREAEPNKGGTLYPVVMAQCLVDATIERAGWLETYSPGKK